MMTQFIIEDLGVQENFNVENLYNVEKGLSYKEYGQLLKIAFEKEYIKVRKYVIDRNLEGQIMDIYEQKGKTARLLHKLKCWPNESDFFAAQFVYILEKINPDYELISGKCSSVKIGGEIVSIRPRLDGENAEPRLYFENAKVAMTSTHEEARNLIEILLVKDTKVFVIGLDDSFGDLIAYEIERGELFYEFCEVAIKRTKDLQVMELFRNISVN